MYARCSEWYISFPKAFDDAGEYMELSLGRLEIREVVLSFCQSTFTMHYFLIDDTALVGLQG